MARVPARRSRLECPKAHSSLRGVLAEIQRQTGDPDRTDVVGRFFARLDGRNRFGPTSFRAPGRLVCVFRAPWSRKRNGKSLAEKRGQLPVLQSHGYFDPILPFTGAEALRNLLTGAGLDVEFLPFDGPHTIPYEGPGTVGPPDAAGVCRSVQNLRNPRLTVRSFSHSVV